MEERKQARLQIYNTIRFIEQKEAEMEEIRLDLNHEIMFNLRDTYLTIANHHTALTMRQLAIFLAVPDSASSLHKMVKWNNHSNSLNLSFAEFSAVIITKEDRLLAKMVLEREEMGAIPNYLLDKVRSILLRELEVHEACLRCTIGEEEVREWVESVVDENGDLSPLLLNGFLQSYSPRGSRTASESSSSEESLFMRFLQSSGSLTGEQLMLLWKDNHQCQSTHDLSSKLQILSTNLSSPKSLLPSQSSHNLRPEFYDCLNRPPNSAIPELRKTRSIQKHVNRINSEKNLKTISKCQKGSSRLEKLTVGLIELMREVMWLEKETERCRIDVRLCPDFYPVLFYQSIPKDRSRNVTPTILKDYLDSFGCYSEINQIFHLFRRYSSGSVLSFNNFCSIFDTVEKEFDLLQRNRFIESLQDVTLTTKKLYFSLLLLVIRNQIRINSLKLAYFTKCRDVGAVLDYFFDKFGSCESEVAEHELQIIFREYLKINVMSGDARLLLRRCGRIKAGESRCFPQVLGKEELLRELKPYGCK